MAFLFFVDIVEKGTALYARVIIAPRARTVRLNRMHSTRTRKRENPYKSLETRCLICITVHSDAELVHADLTAASVAATAPRNL